MDPILSMDIQNTLNSDIAMILDSLVDIDKDYNTQLQSINTTKNGLKLLVIIIRIIINLVWNSAGRQVSRIERKVIYRYDFIKF